MAEWKDEIRDRVAPLGLAPEREIEIVQELAQHLDDRYAELLSAGSTGDEAARIVRAELAQAGPLETWLRGAERRRPANPVVLGDRRKGSIVADALRDVRHGLRSLRKTPAFTATALVTLALGIGVNTAIFSLVYAVLLRPLPFRDSGQLVLLAERMRDGPRSGVAYPNYRDWADRARSFEEMSLLGGQSHTLIAAGMPLRVGSLAVSWNFFRILGVEPAAGRLFVPADDKPGAPATAIISNKLWHGQFGAEPGLVGSAIRVGGEPYTLVGILPAGSDLYPWADLYVPVGLSLTEKSPLLDRGNHSGYYVVARLKPGATAAQADSEMKSLAAAIAAEHPDTNSGFSAAAESLEGMLVENVRPTLWLLLAAVTFVLLIACANVANLMLVRASQRRGEIAVRLAVGASRGRIVRQLLCESLLLAIGGGTAGLLIGSWAMRGMVALAPEGTPRLEGVALRAPVFLFTLAVALAVGILFGLAPALQAAWTDPNTARHGGTRSTPGPARERMRRALVVVEVALALVLLVGAGLMTRTVVELVHVDPGFEADHLLTARFALPAAYDDARRVTFYDECLARIRALPGVRSAALTLSLPIDGSNWDSVFVVAGQPSPPRAQLPIAAFVPATSGYFDTMGMRLLRGRRFQDGDSRDAPRVTIVNEALARRFWPGEDPIGKRLKQGWPESEAPWREVVGVVSDVKLQGVDRSTPLQVYLPLAQESASSLAVAVRTEGDPNGVRSGVERAIHGVDPELAVYRVSAMDELMGRAIARPRSTVLLLAGFAFLALALAAIGIYGVTAYAVSQRTQDFGIRMALGARPQDVRTLVVRQGVTLAAAGVGVGLVAALALAGLIESLLFGVTPTDPMTYGAISLLLIAVAGLACYVPARRATRIDPATALRHE